MTESAELPSESSEWLGVLQHALTYLYDPVQLQESPLVQHFGLPGQGSAASALREILTKAIEAIQPDHTVPVHTNSVRYYQLLYQRYVEQFSQQEVAGDLGLSVRQLRRIEKSAILLLAQQLAAQDQSRSNEPARHEAREQATPSWKEELAWSQKAIPNEPVDAAELLAAATKTASPLLEALGLSLEQTILGHLPSLDVQVVPVRQALLSVLTTLARRAPGGKITVEARSQADAVLVRLAVDTAASQALVLEIGERESLSMAGELIKLSGGTFDVDANHSQSGTVSVDLVLPAETQITIVAVDDNPDTLQLLKRYTAGTRYRLVGIREPHRLLQVVEEVHPELVILDIMLPGVDGWELLGRLRAHPVFGVIPVIVATILPQEQLASALGASAFLRKPIQRRGFLDLLDVQFSTLRS